MIEKYLNVRYSTRNLSDEEFEKILPILAEELVDIDYTPHYDDKILLNDWHNLCSWESTEPYINSTSRIGLKLGEHFFKNFFSIENKDGKSFENMWTKSNLEKILKWNRSSHSTPYLSEIKRGLYFCCGLTKNTMFRPQIAKMICDDYKPEVVFDPCAGWGGRMLGVVSSGAEYIAFEPNTDTYKNLLRLAKFLNIEKKVKIICDDVLHINNYDLPNVDMILTSPPYFNVEIYNKESTQSITHFNTYDNWVNGFLEPTITNSLRLLNKGGISCWNVGKVDKKDMFDDVITEHKKNNYEHRSEYSVLSSKRPISNKTEKIKSVDITKIFKKIN